MENYKYFTIENKHVERDANGRAFLITDSTDEWAVAFFPGLLGVQKNGVKKWVKVEDDRGFTYKLMKTKIKAREGAEGLFHFICENTKVGDLFFCHTTKILTWAFDVMREAA